MFDIFLQLHYNLRQHSTSYTERIYQKNVLQLCISYSICIKMGKAHYVADYQYMLKTRQDVLFASK